VIASRRRRVALLVPVVGALLSTALAGATTHSLSGSCKFSGPITPNPPITIVPKPGAHFSYAGKGTCDGSFGGAAVKALPFTMTFTNVATAFDTCELGPDFNLHGTLSVRSGGQETDFPITIDLARLALIGPFTLTTSGGGNAAGIAQFVPANAAGAIQQCAGAGVASATLSGSFKTSAALVGTVAPATVKRRRAHHGGRPRPRRGAHGGHRASR
jgi:hypothetical protein